jgi:hypothetical protein
MSATVVAANDTQAIIDIVIDKIVRVNISDGREYLGMNTHISFSICAYILSLDYSCI